MNTLIRFRESPVTANELKMNIFAPVERRKSEIVEDMIVYEDDRWKVSITGYHLNQIHRDILDIILHFGNTNIENQISDGIPVRTFSLYQIQKHLGYKSKKHASWIRKKFSELKNVSILLEDKKERENIEFSIVRVVKHSEKLQTYVLVMEELYMLFFEKQISINYKELLPKILFLKHAQTKAVIRYFLTYTKGHQINIDKLLRKVGVLGSQRNLEIIRKKVIKELEEIGEIFNITLQKTSDDRRKNSDILIKYIRHKDVKIYYPNKLAKRFDTISEKV